MTSSYARFRKAIEAELSTVLASGSTPLYDMMRYHLGWVDSRRSRLGAGKMSRPILCLAACEAAGGEWRRAVPAAAAIELVHNFSLIHDDIQDRSHERRGRPAIWKVWGEAQAINAGDAMYALAQTIMARLENRRVAPDKIVLLSKMLNQASINLCEGQYLDISYEGQPDISIQQYLDMIGKKTASLFELSLYAGALLGTEDQTRTRALRAFGRNLGMAFQIHNDLLGIWGEAEESKESPYTDIFNKKKTLPVIYTCQQADPEQKETLVRIMGKRQLTMRDVRRIIRLLNKTGARKYSEKVRKRYHRQAMNNLGRAGLAEEDLAGMKAMADFLITASI